MPYTEEALVFDCAGDALLGIVALPSAPAHTGVLVLVGGPQYRVGSQRQFVLLARALAQAGHSVLRFDYRGMGDSGGEPRNFDALSADIGAAIDAFMARLPVLKQVVLWGLCDGASAALLYQLEKQDARVAGLCLLNPWLRDTQSLARVHIKHYYRQRLGQKAFWLKLLRGQVARDALPTLLRKLHLSTRAPKVAGDAADASAFQPRMAAAWQQFKRPLLLLLSGEDEVAKEFLDTCQNDPLWRGALTRPNVQRCDVAGADHTFSSRTAQQQVQAQTLAWLAQAATTAAPASSVQSYRHPDELPPDVVQLFAQAEAGNLESGLAWYRNLVNTVYPDCDGVRIHVLRQRGAPVAALPVLTQQPSRWGQQTQSLANYYTTVYAPLLQTGLSAAQLVPLIQALKDTTAPDASFRFAPMDHTSADYQTLREALRQAGLLTFDFFCAGNWYLPVQHDWPTYLQQRPRTLRNNIRQMQRKFTAAGGTLEVVQGGPTLERALQAYQQVYAASWKPAEPYPEFVPGLIRSGAESGWLRLGVAWLGAQPVAAQLWRVAHGKAEIYKMAYDERFKAHAPGTLLTARLMEHVMSQDGVSEVDYLSGDDPHKQLWMSQRRERWGLIAYNPRTVGGLVGLGQELLGRWSKPLRARLASKEVH